MQPDVGGERAAAAVAGGPAGAEPAEHRGAAAGEGEAAAGAGRSVSREDSLETTISSFKTTFCSARLSFLTVFLPPRQVWVEHQYFVGTNRKVFVG